MAADNATINLYINNDNAVDKVKELDDELKKLHKTRNEAYKAGNIKEMFEIQDKERIVVAQLAKAKEKELDIEKAMAKLSIINIRQMTDVRGKLRREISSLNQGTDEYIKKQQQLRKVEEQLAAARGKKNSTTQTGPMENIKSLWSNILPIGGIASVFSIAGNFVKGLVSDIWTLTQTIQGDSKRAMTVFGDELGYVELQAERLSKQAGVTTREFVAMTTSTADLLIPLDFSREKAAKMAVDVQKLTGALNEWTAGKFGAEDVSNRLTKAMLGETEGLKELGIAVRLDSDEYKDLIKQKLASGSATTAQAQAEAILELLYKKSADAQAAYSSSGNELLRFQNNSARGWREMKESMAEWFATTKQERVEKLARTYQALNDEFLANEKTLDRLMPVYENLSTKTNLNETEQQQLRDAIDGIVQIIPHAATGFDEYGKALGINTKAVANFREAQRLLNLEMNKDVSEGLKETLLDQLKIAAAAPGALNTFENKAWVAKYFKGYSGDKLKAREVELDELKGAVLVAEKNALIEAAKTISMMEQLGYTREEIANFAQKEVKFNYVNLDLINKITDAYNNQLSSTRIEKKEAEIAKLKEELSKLTDQTQIANKKAEIATAEADLKSLKGETTAVVGLIESKEKELKKLQDELPKLTDEKEIATKNKEIEKLEEEMKNLKDLGKSSRTSGSEPQSWSLDGDKAFLEARAGLKERMFRGEIASEEEYNKLVLALEIATIERRINMNEEGGEELLKLRETLLEKQLQQDKSVKAERQKLLELLDSGKSETERAEIEYRKQLIAYGLFTAEQLDNEEAYLNRSKELDTVQYSALELLSSRHRSKLREIYNKALTDKLEKELQDIEKQSTQRKIAQDRELSELQTFEQKKQFLVERFGVENLSAITNEKDADNALTEAYARENEEIVRQSLQRQVQYYTAMMVSIQAMNPIGVALDPEQLEKYKEILATLEAELAKYKGNDPNTKKIDESKVDDKVDLLGMTAKGWDGLFENIKTGKMELEDVVKVAGAIGQAFSQVNEVISAMEQKEFKKFEKIQNKKKKSLESRLKSGAISQEFYNTQVEALDKQTDLKREEMERKQAERAKTAAVFQALINTALGVTAALSMAPPANFILAGIVGLLGAAQVATILATPLPGAEEGGYVDVTREQDGKHFRARRDYSKLGRIDQPTVLVAENGPELVVPNDGYNNPTLRPVLDMVNDSITRGDIRTFNFDAAITTRRPQGYNEGGVIGQPPISTPTPVEAFNQESNGFTKEQWELLLVLLKQLLKKPISVSVAGKNGINANQDKYESFRKQL